MVAFITELKDSKARHILQNAAMGVPLLRKLSKRWLNMGMGRSREKILPVLQTFLEMLALAGIRLQDKTVVELGPGQTPDLLFGSLLFGASKAVGLDVTSYLDKDILRVDHYAETVGWLSEAQAEGLLPQSQAYNGQRFAGQEMIPNGRLDILMYDGVSFPLDDETADIIWSKSVLEHVRDYRALISEMKRVLKPGGIMCHIIDLRDHSTLENDKDWLRFLRYSDELWDAMMSNRTCWSNRLRVSQWEDLLQEAGLQPVTSQKERDSFHAVFQREKLVEPFCGLDDEDLEVAWFNIVYRK